MPWSLSHLGSGLRDCGLWEKQVPSYPRIPTWQLHRTRSEGTGGWVVVWVNGSLHLSMRSRKPAWTKPTPSGSQNLKRWRCEGRSSKERPRHTSRSHVPATEPSGKCSLRLRRYRGEAGVGCGRKRDHPPLPGCELPGRPRRANTADPRAARPLAPPPGVRSWAAVLEGLEGLGASSCRSRAGSWVGQGVAKLSSAMALQVRRAVADRWTPRPCFSVLRGPGGERGRYRQL